MASSALTIKRILQLVDAHHVRTGQWPRNSDGVAVGERGLTWHSIDYWLQRRSGKQCTLAMFLKQRRGVAKHHRGQPTLSDDQVLRWADSHYRRTGRWPRASSGAVFESPDLIWKWIDRCLQRGACGLSGGLTLARLLERKRHVHIRQRDWPPLSEERILQWARSHQRKTGRWPTLRTGKVLDYPTVRWDWIEGCLRHGRYGLRGGTSLNQLLKREGIAGRERSDRTRQLTLELILVWADQHFLRTRQWPGMYSGRVFGDRRYTWSDIQRYLKRYHSSSIARFLKHHRGRERDSKPRLTTQQILRWCDSHFARFKRWPQPLTMPVQDAPGETWAGLNAALDRGLRGLPGGTTLHRLITKHRDLRVQGTRNLTRRQILDWADKHFRRTGRWPTQASGPVADAPHLKWGSIHHALQFGRNRLPGGSSLSKLLASRRARTSPPRARQRRNP